jgi:uncharacterized protein YkwD
MNSNTTTLTRLALSMALVASLAACGGGGGGDASPAPSPAPAPAPAPAPSPSTGDLSTTVKATSYTAGSRQDDVYQAVNTVRKDGGFGTVAQSVALDNEAQNQADWVAAHYTMASPFGGVTFDGGAIVARQPDGSETGHVQVSTFSGSTGYSATDRAVHFGYSSNNDVAEGAAFYTVQPAAASDASTCVNDLLMSPGHRQLLLDPRFRDVGIGYTTLSQPFDTSGFYSQDCFIATAAPSNTYSSTGLATAASDWVAVFPADGATVSSTMDGHAGSNGVVHGYAPSVTVDSHLTLTVNSFTITDPSGAVVPTTLNTDALNQSGWTNWAFATPNAVLQANTTYTVNFQGSAGGKAIAKVWTFTTPAQ